MTPRRTFAARRILTLSSAAALVACSDTAPPTASTPVETAPAVAARTAPPFSSYIVVYKDGTGLQAPQAGARITASMQAMPEGVIVETLESLNAIVVAGAAPEKLQAMADVQAVVPNYEHQIIDPAPSAATITTITDAQPTGTNQSGAFFFGNNTQWDMKRVQVDRAWIPSRGGLGSKVCIVDSGIDAGHSSFIGKSIVATSLLPNSSPVDSNFHGSHVAGTISTNGFGNASMTPDASLMVAKVFNAAGGGATTAIVLGAVQWCADNGADVINMSLGFTGGVPRAGNQAFIAFYQAGLDYATSRGVLIVAAAGNDAAVLPHATNIWLPAEASGVVSVAATGPASDLTPFGLNAIWNIPGASFDGIASYSNRGTFPSVAVSAPGGNRPSGTWPVQSLIISPCSRFAHPSCVSGNNFAFAAGTSMASPHVAGLAALIRGRWPTAVRGTTLRNRIEQCIYRSTDVIGSASTFGRGRINAYKAMTMPC